jgi:hypothetical protein
LFGKIGLIDYVNLRKKGNGRNILDVIVSKIMKQYAVARRVEI